MRAVGAFWEFLEVQCEVGLKEGVAEANTQAQDFEIMLCLHHVLLNKYIKREIIGDLSTHKGEELVPLECTVVARACRSRPISRADTFGRGEFGKKTFSKQSEVFGHPKSQIVDLVGIHTNLSRLIDAREIKG